MRPTGAEADAPRRERHLYSAANVNRVNVVTGLGVLGAAIAAAIVLLIPNVDHRISAGGGVVAATVLSSAIFALYEKRVWRSRVAAGLPGTTVPDMRGTWSGTLVVQQSDSREAIDTPLTCEVRIEQDWSRITIDLKTAETESWSVMATVDVCRLHYEYYVIPRSTPEGRALGSLEPHYGMARLILSRNVLRGHWFNDQPFQRSGEIELRRLRAKASRRDRSAV
jgi:hypothetical protein